MSTTENELPVPLTNDTTGNVVDAPVPPHTEDELQEDDLQNLDEIERELAKTMGVNGDEGLDDEDEFGEEDVEDEHGVSKSMSQSTDFLPSGAMPTINGKLSSHAAEFWFPGSRDCKCCKGFKYGCDCCTKNAFQACQEPGCVEPSDVGKKREAPLQVKTGHPASTNSASNSPHKPLPSPINASGVVYCKFQFSPGGCRFGATCRFIHQGAAGTGGNLSRSGSLESPKGDGRQICVYFMKGSCDFGDKCRFLHPM